MFGPPIVATAASSSASAASAASAAAAAIAEASSTLAPAATSHRISGSFHTSECRGGVERRQMELKGVEVCRD
jgi:hypothetical protein